MNRDEVIHFAKCLKNNYTIDFNDMEDFCNAVIESQYKLKDIEDLINDENIGETDAYSLIEMSILHDFRGGLL